MRNIVVAVDGRASTGKSTLAKHIAKELKLNYIDSGVFYRYATYLYLELSDLSEVLNRLSETAIELKDNVVFFNNVSSNDLPLRTPEIGANISPLAAKESIRNWVTEQLRNLGNQYAIIMDGRDIGTVVFPNADLKIFVTASAEIRAKRRFKEFQEAQHNITLEQTLKDIEERDHIDENRAISPLTKADDAMVLDNSFLSFEDFLQKGIEMVNSVI